jgi:hypothetical protein
MNSRDALLLINEALSVIEIKKTSKDELRLLVKELALTLDLSIKMITLLQQDNSSLKKNYQVVQQPVAIDPRLLN